MSHCSDNSTRYRRGLWLIPGLSLLLSACLDQTQQNDPVPVLLDYPIAYVKRPVPLNNQGEPIQPSLVELDAFHAGADLFLRQRASPSAPERNLTFRFTGGRGDVKDVESSADGSKLLFAMRAPELANADEDEQPTWNIWEYELASDTLTRVIASDIRAEAGQDIAPHYLPDGRIIFASTRQRDAGAILLDEGKPKFAAQSEDRNAPAFVLHVMDSDGSNIQQISFNLSHDLDPTVLSNGYIIFSRWDHMGGRNAIRLYKIQADGSGLEIAYGAHSHDNGVQITQPRELPDGRIAARLLPFRGTHGSGRFVAIDLHNYLDRNYPRHSNLADGEAETELLDLALRSGPGLAGDGYVRDFYPLWDDSNRALISWSPCRLIEQGDNDEAIIVPCTPARLAAEAPEAAAPLYGIYIYDLNDHTQLPVVPPEEGMMIHEVVATYDRLSYALPNTRQLDSALAGEGVGVLNIRSVYDVDGVDSATPDIAALADPAQTRAAQRPARFLRIVKGVPLPDNEIVDLDNSAFGRSRQQLMREIIGYAPIEPDGSVMVKVPANVPLALSVLDQYGRRIGARHQNWLQLRPGETKRCNGCHDHDSGIPHGSAAGPASAYPGATHTGAVFPNTDNSIRAQAGETMAETLARLSCESDCAYLTPSVDIHFRDHWTDTAVRAKDPELAYRYADLSTPLPSGGECISSWTPLCRVVIHYEAHIHPLWSVVREVIDPDTLALEDRSCTRCHNDEDDVGNGRVPAGQLDLSDGPSSDEPDHFKAYRELLFNDNEQELVDNVLQDRLVQASDGQGNPLFETDEDGNLILGLDGEPVPILVTVPAPGPSMSANGANSSDFFAKFATDGSHAGWLSEAEQKLIAEWLDIGAQYYNDPFAVPAP